MLYVCKKYYENLWIKIRQTRVKLKCYFVGLIIKLMHIKGVASCIRGAGKEKNV